MIILIDAYNLFKTVLHTKFVVQKELIIFLQLFEKYAKIRSHKIILVFDGDSDTCQFIDDYHLITIYYSGYKQTADDLIKIKLQLLKGQDILLVTSDRDIRKFAQQLLIESIGSQEFYKILQNVMQSKNKQETVITQTIHKTSDNHNPELDLLMEIGSRKLITKEIDKKTKFFISDDSKQYRSKKDKKLFKKIIKI